MHPLFVTQRVAKKQVFMLMLRRVAVKLSGHIRSTLGLARARAAIHSETTIRAAAFHSRDGRVLSEIGLGVFSKPHVGEYRKGRKPFRLSSHHFFPLAHPLLFLICSVICSVMSCYVLFCGMNMHA